MLVPAMSQFICPVYGSLVKMEGPYPSDQHVCQLALAYYRDYCEYRRRYCGCFQESLTEMVGRFERATSGGTAVEVLFLVEKTYIRSLDWRARLREDFKIAFGCTVQEYTAEMGRRGFGLEEVETLADNLEEVDFDPAEYCW